MPKLSSLSVFFPSYNEAPNLELLISKADTVIPTIAKKYELIIINDGSIDDTLKTVKDLQKQFRHLKIVSHSENSGYGAALKTGFSSSIYDWVFFTDADLQFDISEIKNLITHTEKYDAIIGWRKKRVEGGKRAFNAKVFKVYIDLLYRLHVKDIDCAFKLFRRTVVQAVTLESNGAFTTAELLYKLKKKHVKFKEVPVTHYPRFKGTPTGAQLKVILRACWESMSLYLKIKSHTHISK